jgi:hypothetical protein
MRVVTVGYWAILPSLYVSSEGEDHLPGVLLPVDAALGVKSKLAFDHHLILSDAVEVARLSLETSTVAVGFVSGEFTIPELRRVYEAVWGVELDGGNFQRRITEIPDFLVPTGRHRRAQRGRPAELYQAQSVQDIDPPIRRPAPDEETTAAAVFLPAVNKLGIAPVARGERFAAPGWVYEGTPLIPCPECGGKLYVWRKPYESGGKAYRYWAVVCDREKVVRDLKWFNDRDTNLTKELRAWSKVIESSSYDVSPDERLRTRPHDQRESRESDESARSSPCRRCGGPTAEWWHEYCDSCFDLLDPARQASRDAEQLTTQREARLRELRRRAGHQNYDDDT